MSCGTCHIQSKSFTDGRSVAIGTYQDTLDRNTMSLINLAWAEHFFWDGRKSSLEELIRDPVTNSREMAQDTVELIEELSKHYHYPKLFELAFPKEQISMELVSKSIAQFLRTIVSNGLDVDYNTLPGEYGDYDKRKSESNISREISLRGSFFRFSEMCGPCHGGAVYGGSLMANNGLADSSITAIKVPSLLNVVHTAPYMHDGRFASLSEVMEHYSEHLNSFPELNSNVEVRATNFLLDYDIEHVEDLLMVFQDTSVLVNSDFSDPFTQTFDWHSY